MVEQLTAQAQPRSRLHGIQAGRAIAALAVVITHAVGQVIIEPPVHAHFFARYGVTLFFVISGYIMVVSTGPAAFDPLRFVKNRVRRIVPLYWIAVFLMAALTLLIPSVFRKTAFDAAEVVKALFFIPSYAEDGSIRPFLKLGWTLNFEMFFYLCFACLFAFTDIMRAALLSALFLFLIALGSVFDFQSAPLAFYTRIDTLGFVAGVWLAVATRRLPPLHKGNLLAAGFASLVIVAAILAYYEPIRDNPWTQIWVIIACALQVAVLAGAPRLGWSTPRSLEVAGDASYSIYLFHMFGVGLGALIIAKILPGSVWIAILVAALLGAMSGLAVYALLEARMNRWIRRMTDAKRQPNTPIRPLSPNDGL
ncbi:acyltransferase [Altererythrobacter sp. B11]|nr:acyltransferase [Altererythrobacter sp. B11]